MTQFPCKDNYAHQREKKRQAWLANRGRLAARIIAASHSTALRMDKNAIFMLVDIGRDRGFDIMGHDY